VPGPLRSLAVVAVALFVFTAAALAQPLNTEIEALVVKQGLAPARVSAYAIDLRTGEELLSINADERLIPASNMKMLTSGAFLSVMGADAVFRTEAWRSGNDVLIVGSGDPALADPDLLEEMGLSVEEFLDLWAQQIDSRFGEDTMGELLIDDRSFDQTRVHPSWPVDQLNRWYCAEVSALNFHANVLHLHLAPGEGGGPPRIAIEPASHWLTPRNLARTTTKGRNTAWVSRKLGTNEMTLHGSVRWSTAAPIKVAVDDPALLFGRLLAERLAQLGRERPHVRRLNEHELPSHDTLLLAVETDVEDVLERCNVDSQNLYAEALFKRLASEVTGSRGDWASGVAVMRMILQEKLSGARGVGVATDAVIADGSGMSRENRVTARLMARWLEAMSQEPVAPIYYESLPIAGEEGTLRKRFRNNALEGEVRAKSGYLSGVSCLSGYVMGADNTPVAVFSVLVNDIPKNVAIRNAKTLHERVALAIEDLVGDDSLTADVAR